jgi:acetylornithine deacetylase
MMLPAREVLALHRAITGLRSVSGEEGALADYLTSWLERRGHRPHRIGNSLLIAARGGNAAALPTDRPLLLFDSHLDTVPAAAGWSRDPWDVESRDGKVIGLGSNDAKAAVTGMIAALLAYDDVELPFTFALALVEGEETRGTGTEAVLAELAGQGVRPSAAVVGEPTGLDIAIAQKGLLVLELVARGDDCHAAHAAALGARNAARELARDLVALGDLDLGPGNAQLGLTSVEPTQLRGSAARNAVPGEASAILDVRTVPDLPAAQLLARLRGAVQGEVKVLSDRLGPCATDPHTLIVEAARRVLPESRLFGSRTLSDMVFFRDLPVIKCGPGASERSHTADEFVWEDEILDGARFYTRLVGSTAEVMAGSATPVLARVGAP